MKKQKIIYAIDWLQVYCTAKIYNRDYPSLYNQKVTSPEMNKFGYHNEYTLIKAKEVIVGYQWVASVVWKEFTIATIAAIPKDSRKDSRGCAIKISNQVLYTSTWYHLLNDLAITMQWEIHNLTRIDIAADFNYFWHGLHPQTFIRNYAQKGKNGYIRTNSNKFHTDAERDYYRVDISTIRWGSRKSGVSVYLYNKSKELKEKKDKPWIRHLWKLASLKESDVWRLEFSINNQGMNLRELSNGLIHTLFHDDLSEEQSIKSFFYSYQRKYFSFKHIEVAKNGTKQKKKCQLKDVVLFNPDEEVLFKPISINRSRDTGRIEKVVNNRLMQEYDYIMSTDDVDKYTIASAIVTMMNYNEERYNLKRDAAENERAIRDLAKNFSKEYLKQRLKLTWVMRRDARKIHDIVITATENLVISKEICQPKDIPPICEGTTIVPKAQYITKPNL